MYIWRQRGVSICLKYLGEPAHNQSFRSSRGGPAASACSAGNPAPFGRRDQRLAFSFLSLDIVSFSRATLPLMQLETRPRRLGPHDSCDGSMSLFTESKVSPRMVQCMTLTCRCLSQATKGLDRAYHQPAAGGRSNKAGGRTRYIVPTPWIWR